jgi:hypothetical protein
MVAGLVSGELARESRRSPALPAEEQVPQVTEDLVTNLLLLGIAGAKREPYGDSGVQHENAHETGDVHNEPAGLMADLREQAEQRLQHGHTSCSAGEREPAY